MLELARNETAGQIVDRKAKEAFFVYKGSDIKTDKDKEDMINTRINHYTVLQNKVLERQLLKDIRTAYKAGDKETHRKLLNEWKDKYGKGK